MGIPERPVPVNTTELHWSVLEGLDALQESIPTLPADVAHNTERINALEARITELEKKLKK